MTSHIDQIVIDINKLAKNKQNALIEDIDDSIEEIFDTVKDDLVKSVEKSNKKLDSVLEAAKIDVQKTVDDSNDKLYQAYIKVNNLLSDLQKQVVGQEEKHHALYKELEKSLLVSKSNLEIFNEKVVSSVESFREINDERNNDLIKNLETYHDHMNSQLLSNKDQILSSHQDIRSLSQQVEVVINHNDKVENAMTQLTGMLNDSKENFKGLDHFNVKMFSAVEVLQKTHNEKNNELLKRLEVQHTQLDKVKSHLEINKEHILSSSQDITSLSQELNLINEYNDTQDMKVNQIRDSLNESHENVESLQIGLNTKLDKVLKEIDLHRKMMDKQEKANQSNYQGFIDQITTRGTVLRNAGIGLGILSVLNIVISIVL